MGTLDRAILALSSRLRDQIGMKSFMTDRPDYVNDFRDNLMSLIEPSMFEQELREGDGSELEWQRGRPPKFQASFSSSALAVNSFAPWKACPGQLVMAGMQGFEALRFEAKCPNSLDTHHDPHLDVLAEVGNCIVGVESKFTEFLHGKNAKFSDQYETLVGKLFEPQWLAIYQNLKKKHPRFYRHLDAAQLVKHYLGLRNTYPNHTIILFYLFWEPINADSFPEFQRHRSEINDFSSQVSDAAITFASMSYCELWRAWGTLKRPDWLAEHLADLGARYEVAI